MSKSTKYAISGTGRWGALRFAVLVLALCLLQAPGILAAPAAAAQAGNAAAKHRVQGTVVDQAGAPVIGANVIVEGTTTGTTTDAKGAFSLEVPAKGRLLISYLGYETQQVTLTSQTQYMVTLRENTAAIADVVVVGYGVQRKESVVGAISQVKGDALVDSGVSNITNALAGKLSGVTTLQTSGQPGQNDAEILIRGVSSFSNSNPLVLVDGVGNRVGAVCDGPEQVYFVISHSKVVDGGINTAIARIKKTACPPNARRQGLDTACARTGMCGPDCHDSMCRLTLAVDRAPRGRKITVLFVEETLGY